MPEDAIVLENEGGNSYESLEGVAGLLGERGLSDVLIVTDPYHSLRSRLIAEELGLDRLRVPDAVERGDRRRVARAPLPGGRRRLGRPPRRVRPAVES